MTINSNVLTHHWWSFCPNFDVFCDIGICVRCITTCRVHLLLISCKFINWKLLFRGQLRSTIRLYKRRITPHFIDLALLTVSTVGEGPFFYLSAFTIQIQNVPRLKVTLELEYFGICILKTLKATVRITEGRNWAVGKKFDFIKCISRLLVRLIAQNRDVIKIIQKL